MGRTFIFAFDGTCNDPRDAEQAVDLHGHIEDNNISNVLKFHLLCGGSLAEQGRGWNEQQHAYYYAGIGVYGNRLQQLINAAFAPEGSDVAQILKRAIIDFTRSNFKPVQDTLLVVGFSRGAALARRFVAILARTITLPCVYEAVFDTVASIGNADLSKHNRPKSEVLFENCSLPGIVIQALHLVSLDDKRKAFQPTLMNREAKVHEIWFAGAHADVGGGYHQDGLSDNALRYLIDWLEDRPFPLQIKSYKAVDYQAILPAGVDYRIGADDLMLNADPLAVSHQQQRSPLLALMTLEDRACCVIEGDQIVKQARPLIHWSVAWRIYARSSYRPASLKNVDHLLLGQNGQTTPCTGLAPHIELPQQQLKTLAPGQRVEVTVYAADKYNRSGLYLMAGERYQFDVLSGQHWRDGDIECDATGWQRHNVTLGAAELPIAAMEFARRLPDADWFTLCAAIGDNESELFAIGKQCLYTPKRSGEFCPFANDLSNFYGNNSGKLRISVTRLARSGDNNQ